MFTQAPFLLTPTAAAVAAVVSNPYDPYWSSVVLLCPFDVSTTDVKNGLTPSAANAVDITGVGKFNSGLKMQTSSSSLKFASSANYNFGTAPWTIDGWVSFPSTPTNFYVFDIGSNGFYLQYMNGAWTISGNGLNGLSASYPITAGAKYYFELNRSGTVVRLFMNGVAIITQAVAASTTMSSTSVLTIGCYGGGGGYSMANAVIDDFRITKGVQRNATNYTPPTAAAPTSANEGSQVVRLWNFDTDYKDSKIADAPTTSTGVSIVAAGGKFSGGVKFASAASILRYAASVDFSFGVLPFTIAGWIMRSSTQSTGDYIYIFDIGNNGFFLQWSPSVGWNLYGNGGVLAQFSQAFAADVFTHFEICRSGTSLLLFINGIIVASVTVNAGTAYGSNATLTIGAAGANGYAPINGVMDDFEVIKGYARHSANFTPPTAPYTLTV